MMLKKVLESKWNLALMVASWMGLLWVRTFVGIVNGYSDSSTFGLLDRSVWVVFLTILFGFVIGLFFKRDEENGIIPDCLAAHEHLTCSMCLVLAIAGLGLLSISVSAYYGWMNIFNNIRYMQLGALVLNKKYFFGILMMVVFPLWTTYIIRNVRDAGFSVGCVISGTVQILVLSLVGYMLYMQLPNIWTINMGMVNILTLVVALRTYAWDHVEKKGNCIALIIMYILFWGLLLSLFHYEGQTFTNFMTNNANFNTSSPDSYISNVNKILHHASLFGQSTFLSGDSYVLEFLGNRKSVILSALFYGGWAAAIALILLEMLFVISYAAVLFRNRKKDGLDVMLITSWLSLLIRLISGIAYSFGFPIPILIPFSGPLSILECSVSVGLLFLCCLMRKEERMIEEIYIHDPEEDYENEY